MNLINELDESQTLQKDLYNMELERINYMLRNYLRDRLRKVGARPAPRAPAARPDQPGARALRLGPISTPRTYGRPTKTTVGK